MKASNKTKGLYWLGVKGKLARGFGGVLIVGGLLSFILSWVLAIILIGLGIFLIIKGSQNDLEYKRESGHIIYRG